MSWTLFFQIVMLVIVCGLVLDMLITTISKARAPKPVEGKSEKLYTSD
jgi:hypothetical protein